MLGETAEKKSKGDYLSTCARSKQKTLLDPRDDKRAEGNETGFACC